MYALIATHNAALRSAITVLLRICNPGCSIVAAHDVADVHEVLESGRCDTMLLDVMFSGYGSAFDVDMLRRYYPRVNFLPLGNPTDANGMLGALEHGLDDPMLHDKLADDAMLLDTIPSRRGPAVDHLLRAIEVIGSAEVMGAPPLRAQPAERSAEPTPSLTARQHDVLRLLGEGRSTKDIARRLGLAVPTVKTHLAAIYRELGARNRVEAVVKAGMSRSSGRSSRARPGSNTGLGFGDASFLYGAAAS